jgi:hypothetical protein
MMLEKVCVILFHHVRVIAMDFISIERNRIVNRIFNVWIIVLPIKVVVHMDNDSIEISVDVHQLIKYHVVVSNEKFDKHNNQLISPLLASSLFSSIFIFILLIASTKVL